MTTTTDHQSPEIPRGIGAYLAANLREYGLLFALIAIMAFFQIVTNGTLLKPVNVTNLLLQNSYIVIMALGMLIVIVAGHIDLSVGSVMGFVGALAAVMIVELDQPTWITVLTCILAGGLIGAAQGYWVAYWGIPSFIVTLAGMLVFRGASLWLLEGQSLGPFPREFQMIANGFVPDIFPAGLGEAVAGMLGAARVNMLALMSGLIAAAVVLWLELKRRVQNRAYGLNGEPGLFFWARVGIIAFALVFILYKLSTFRGLPNVL
ncbi:MAG: sugar ABC transporter permease, partial [Pseudomonadota bacterium]